MVHSVNLGSSRSDVYYVNFFHNITWYKFLFNRAKPFDQGVYVPSGTTLWVVFLSWFRLYPTPLNPETPVPSSPSRSWARRRFMIPSPPHPRILFSPPLLLLIPQAPSLAHYLLNFPFLSTSPLRLVGRPEYCILLQSLLFYRNCKKIVMALRRGLLLVHKGVQIIPI